MKIYIAGKSFTLRDDQAVGKGGEADVFLLDRKAAKVWKPPNHPDYDGNLHEQQGAKLRLEEHQTKMPQFPKRVPSHVVGPLELAMSAKTGGKVVGYTMPFLPDTEPILRLGEKSFRLAGYSDEQVIRVFRHLYGTVDQLHEESNCVIGDFNDLNVLVKNEEAYVIDADSMQFGKFLCRVFTGKFVDPLLCDPKGHSPMLIRPHNEQSDWYAYLIMLMQSVLFVGPYGGVFRGAVKGGTKVTHDARPLHRITVWNPDVRYPKPAKPLDSLPDSMAEHFRSVFEDDVRTKPPLSLLDSLQFDAQGNMLVTTKPVVTPTITKEVVVGNVRAEKVFDTIGRIVYATYQGGKLRWLYHHDQKYKREHQSDAIVSGPLSPNIRFRISGNKTVLAQGSQVLIFDPSTQQPEKLIVDTLNGQLPLLDANERSVLYITAGELRKTSVHGRNYSDFIGNVLRNQTLFWSGEKLGFGFYRAGQLARYFVFNPQHGGINDSVEVPSYSGQLVDSTCVFGKERVWFFLATREGSKAINRCYLITLAGKVVASAEAIDGDGSWLGSIRGKCGINDFLLCPTDDGIHRVQAHGDTLVVAKEFPDTARVVSSESNIFPGTSGLSVVNPKAIWNVSIS